MADADVKTVGGMLRWTTDRFRKEGIESARLDAEILLAHALGLESHQRIQLYTRTEELPPEAARGKYRDFITRRLAGCPVAHLIGVREFYKLPFEVTPDVLIPRPDTETLVMECIALAKRSTTPRILDIGTGSGCIALSIVHQHKTANALATDISPAALAVARRNAERHGLTNRVEFREGDLFAPLRPGEVFDFIVSNPPYIDPAEIETLAKDVRDHEPRLALDGGPGGLAVYRRLVPEAVARLSPGGWLLVEIGSTQEEAVRGLFDAAGYADVRTARDHGNLPRVVMGRRV